MTGAECVRCARPAPDGSCCVSCMARAGRQLAGDPRDDTYVSLLDALPAARDVAHGQVRRGGVGGGVAGPGVPLDPDAMDRLDGVQNTLTTHARLISEERGVPLP